jgi:glucose 1-dehydrogenase
MAPPVPANTSAATSSQRLANKVAIVTGASTGIGAAIAQAFAREGATVCVNWAGNEAAANVVVQAITTAGGTAFAFQADVSKRADVEAMVVATTARYGHLDILVNNAGVEKRVPFLDVPDDLWDHVIAVNLTGPFYCAQTAARDMAQRGIHGRIINISSVHEDLPMPTNAPYCASKGGLRMLMRTICDELAPHQITVNNIAPGAIDTPMDAPLKLDPAAMSALLAEIPLGRMGQPQEVAELAVYLASDAAAYVTGATYLIDGGLTRYAGSL